MFSLSSLLVWSFTAKAIRCYLCGGCTLGMSDAQGSATAHVRASSQPPCVPGGMETWVGGKAGRVCWPGFTHCHPIPVRSKAEAWPAGLWGPHGVYHPRSALLGSVPSGWWLGKRALGERLRLGQSSWTAAGGIACTQHWEYFLYGFFHLRGYLVLPKLFAKHTKWREKRKKSALFLMVVLKNNIKPPSVAKPQKLPCRSKSRCASSSYWNSIRNLLDPE